MHDHKKIIMIV